MAKFGCPPRFIAMVRQFHDGMQARVQNDGEFSEPFEVTNGVKQGCVLAPTLFSMMFPWYNFYINQYFSHLIMLAVQAITTEDIYRNRIPRDIAYLLKGDI